MVILLGRDSFNSDIGHSMDIGLLPKLNSLCGKVNKVL